MAAGPPGRLAAWMRSIYLQAIFCVLGATAGGEERCEACGLLVWRMQTVLAKAKADNAGLKAEMDKDSTAATESKAKATAAKNRKKQYAEALANALEAGLVNLPQNSTITRGACRSNVVLGKRGEAMKVGGLAIQGSALRGNVNDGEGADQLLSAYEACSKRVAKVTNAVLSDNQDELTQKVLAGSGAGGTCAKLLKGCTAERATLLLGTKYSDAMGEYAALELLAADVGYVPGGRHRREAALAAAREADFEAQDRIADARRLTKEWDSYEAQYKYVYGDSWVPPKEERDDYEAVMKATYGDKWIPRWPQVDIEDVADDDDMDLEKQEL